MAVTVTHNKVATLPDEPGAEVNKDEWNENHVITGLGSAAESQATDFDAVGVAAAGDAAHVVDPDPHTQYQKESEKGAANGYASLDGGGTVPDAQIPTAIARDTEVSSAITASEAGQVRDGDAASGDLAGAYPGPTVTQARGLRETAGPTTLVIGAVADGDFLKRVGSTVVGGSPGAGSTNIKATTVTVSTPVFEASFTVVDTDVSGSSQIMLGWGNCLQTDMNHPGMGEVGFNAVSGTGQFTAELYSTDRSRLFGDFKLNYLVG